MRNGTANGRNQEIQSLTYFKTPYLLDHILYLKCYVIYMSCELRKNLIGNISKQNILHGVIKHVLLGLQDLLRACRLILHSQSESHPLV